MNYQETLDYLYSALPMFHRVGAAAYKADLDTTIALADAAGNPQNELRCIHVAGTNGKGSVANMLASVFQAAGYKTGLYTSPHLRDFRERIRIDGEMIPEEAVTEFVNSHKELFTTLKPSFFEMTTVMAFDWFNENETDIVIIETGMGGRLDSTNIVHPLLSVITNIGWDHMQFLGDTLEKIAGEKAGIIKPGIPVVVGEAGGTVMEVFRKKADEQGSMLVNASELYRADCKEYNPTGDHMMAEVYYEGEAHYRNLRLDLTGLYQLKNITTVIAALDILKEDFELPEAAIRKGLRTVCRTTGFQGRWQILSHEPLTICDSGHNKDGIARVVQNINRTPHQQLHFILGMVEDKDSAPIFELLPQNATYYFCKADIPRGLDAVTLAAQAAERGLSGEVYPSVKAALEAAQKNAGKDDLVFVGGSTFTVAEVV